MIYIAIAEKCLCVLLTYGNLCRRQLMITTFADTFMAFVFTFSLSLSHANALINYRIYDVFM